jgi:hypothetical protein
MTHDPSEPDDTGPAAGDDSILEECLRDALGPYIAALSPEELADYRAFLTLFITTHPAAAALYARLRKRPVDASGSGVTAREGATREDAETFAGDGTFGGRR